MCWIESACIVGKEGESRELYVPRRKKSTVIQFKNIE